MKRLIEKGIGAILLCLQIIMAAATAYVVCYFIYHYVQNAHDEYVSWTQRIQDAKSFGLYSSSNSASVPFSGKWWAISIVVWFFCAVAGLLLGGLAFLFVSNFFRYGVFLYNKEVEKKHYGFPYGYGRSAEDIVHSEFARFKSDSRIGSIAGDFLNTCGYMLEYRLGIYSLAIYVSRKTNDDIESNRIEAEDDLAIYRSREKKSEVNFNKARKYSGLSYFQRVSHECIVLCFTSNFRKPIVHIESIHYCILSWLFEHWFMIACLSLFIFAPRNLINYWSNSCESIIFCSLFVISGFVFLTISSLCQKQREIDRDRIQDFSEDDVPSYKKSASKFVEFCILRPCLSDYSIPSYHILDIFQAFLDLHKEGWRMKIFPFSAERVRQEKADAAARGEEIVIFPDVDEIEARLAEEERKEQRIASIGELN